MRHETRALVLVLACGCAGNRDAAEGAGEGSTGAGTEATTDASTSASATGAGQDGSSGAAESGGGSSTGAGGGGGPVVPCGDDGTADPDEGIICFYDVINPGMEPAATIEHAVGVFEGQQALYIRLTLAPWFCDNTYGVNAMGWPNEHKFKDLTGSDHAEIHLKDPAEQTVFHFKTDYLTADDTAVSGFKCLGVWGGEGEMIAGDDTQILAANSSISRNLNERGYAEYIVDSPATDDDYTPNAATPDWDYRVIYEVWIALDGFTDLPVQACIEFIHASPSKEESNTKEVVPDECPPGWGCYNTDMQCGECDDYVDPDVGDLCDPTDGIPPEG
jgi:hypothetical protein